MSDLASLAGSTIDTAAGPVTIPADLPDWVTFDLLASAASSMPETQAPPAPTEAAPADSGMPVAADVATANTPGAVMVNTPNGIVYAPPGIPSWVLASLVQPNPTPGAPEKPQEPPSGPFKGPATPSIPPLGGEPGAKPGGLSAAAAAVAETARRAAEAARAALEGAGRDVGDVGARILAAVKGTLDTVLPTLSEMAIGLTSRFADLASFVGSKVVGVEDFAATMAAHSASAISTVFEDAWSWLADALLWLLRTMGEGVASEVQRVRDLVQVPGI